MYFFSEIFLDDLSLLSRFIKNAGNSLKSFRYFDSRSLSVIKNHITTALIIKEDEPICYGHLDNDEGKVWLGIAVIDRQVGKGYGKLMMKFLLSKAKLHKLNEVYLSVDKENTGAIRLYESLSFTKIGENENVYFYRLYI